MALQAARTDPGESPTRVDSAADVLALRIAAGTYRAGEHLPSVRALAKSLGINPSTVQVVLARLASLGFVESRRGVGFLVRDIERDGGIETWGYVFRFAQHLPERAARVFADLLGLRRTLVVDVLRTLGRDPARHRGTETRRAVERLSLAVATSPDDPETLAHLELDAFRELTLALGQSALTAVLNSVGEIYLSEPRAVRAMYADPQLHVTMWWLLLDEWDAGTLNEATADRVGEFLARFDEAVVERYVARLRASGEK
jgi:DNA-binding FadR family transcriptional regulator